MDDEAYKIRRGASIIIGVYPFDWVWTCSVESKRLRLGLGPIWINVQLWGYSA